MPLTPVDVHNVAFKKPPIGKRGYDVEEVDSFLDEVGQQLIRLLEDNEALRNRVGDAGAGGPGGGAGGSAAPLEAEFAAATARLERLAWARDRAEEDARTLRVELERVRNAAPAGSARPGDGTDPNSRVLTMAQRTADGHLQDSHRESDALLSAARQESEQVTSEARRKASAIENGARRNHTEAMTRLEADRAALKDEIDRLGQLAQGYHAALYSHVAHRMQELDDPSPAPDAAGD